MDICLVSLLFIFQFKKKFHLLQILAPPSPLTNTNADMMEYTGLSTLSHRFSHHQLNRNNGSNSPPLPPPPPPDQDENSQFGRLIHNSGGMRAIVPDEEDLPGWVPKNYIEKGSYLKLMALEFSIKCLIILFQLLLFMIIMRIKRMN